MKKNYFFGKVIAVMAILFGITLGFVSCGKGDNALEEIINSPESGPSFSVTITSSTSAKAVILIPEDITEALREVINDITNAADAGDTYTLTIDASNLTINDTKISIPKIEGADIELVFENLGNSDETLQFKASSTANNDGSPSATAINNLTIKMPSSSTQDLDINLPDTHVELEGGYGTVNAVTALSTLVVTDGATIQFLRINFDGDMKSSVIVENGGTIESLLFLTGDFFRTLPVFKNNEGNGYSYQYDANNGYTNFVGCGINATSKVLIPVYDEQGNETGNEYVPIIRDEDNMPYLINSAKVIKGEGGKFDNRFALINLNNKYTLTGNWDGNYATIDKLIIAEDAAVVLNYMGNVKEIIGEGDRTATVYYGNVEYTYDYESDQYTGIDDFSNYIDFEKAEKISNVILKPVSESGFGEFVVPDKPQDPNDGNYDAQMQAYNERYYSQISILPNVENSTIVGDLIVVNGNEGKTFSKCSFNTLRADDWSSHMIWHSWDVTEEVLTYATSYIDCKFAPQYKLLTTYLGNNPAEGSTVKITFKGCEYSDDLFNFGNNANMIPGNFPLRFDIDGTLKELEWDGEQNKWNMVNAAD